MSITLDLSDELDDAVAVSEAVNDYIRLKRLQELKEASGKIEISEGWRDMDGAESNDGS